MRTYSGRDWMARIMGNPASTGTGDYAPATWIGLTENDDNPVLGDTVLAGEITTGTLARAQATFSHTSGAQTYTLTKVFTSDQEAEPKKIGVFTAATGGHMPFEALIADPEEVHVGDQYQIVETVTMTP